MQSYHYFHKEVISVTQTCDLQVTMELPYTKIRPSLIRQIKNINFAVIYFHSTENLKLNKEVKANEMGNIKKRMDHKF
uniref:Uncharacterized protein n=2 Tax=Rhizophora mucronata TaxID=61149 RepID=A0A2P2INC0_RHIMU